MTTIDIINTVPNLVSSIKLGSCLPAFQRYANLICVHWMLSPVTLRFVRLADANPENWWLLINGRSDQPGALGYHDEHPNGLPFSRVFATDDYEAGASLTVTLTHELAEMLVDPNPDTRAKLWRAPDRRDYLVEVGDPVEDDIYSFTLPGSKVKLSDFVLPAYYSTGPGPYDYSRYLRHPAPALMSGGYISYLENNQWHQLNASLANGRQSYRAMRAGRSMRARGGALS